MAETAVLVNEFGDIGIDHLAVSLSHSHQSTRRTANMDDHIVDATAMIEAANG